MADDDERWRQGATYLYIATMISAGVIITIFSAWKFYDCKHGAPRRNYMDVANSDDEEEIELIGHEEGYEGAEEAESEESEREESTNTAAVMIELREDSGPEAEAEEKSEAEGEEEAEAEAEEEVEEEAEALVEVVEAEVETIL